MTSLRSALLFITDIGDAASVLAIVIAGCIYLLYRRSSRAAVFLLITFLFSCFCASAAKLAFLNCHNLHYAGIHSPSGHAANATAVFLAYLILMRSQLEQWRRFVPFCFFVLLISLIAISRVWLEFHTTAEVIVGLLCGVCALGLSYFLVLRGKHIHAFDAYALLLWAMAAAAVIHGTQLPSEEWVHAAAGHIKNHMPFCN